ncbi:MAG TPA: ABC transporter substrate-binding protein [Acidimicrobiales bacterium]|nr:ABC transporter substrate-binding protein [Acidimicrobiales bacterium]
MPDRHTTDRLDIELRRIAEALVAEAPEVPESLPANHVVVRLHGGPRRRYLLVAAVVVGVVSLVGALLAATRRAADDADVRVNQQPAVTGPPVGEAAPTCAGDADGRLLIGGLLPETGDLASLGAPMIAAASLAVEEINAAGGVLGRPVEYIPGDSGDGDPEAANLTVDSHLAAGADAVLGAAASGVSLDVIDTITSACRIQFSPANTSPELTDHDDGDLYFRTAPSDVLQGRALADLIVAEGNRTVALLAPQGAYSEGLLDFTKRPLGEQGAEVVVERTYDPEATSFDAEVEAVVAADPDALVMTGFAESSIILNALAARGFTPDEHGVYVYIDNVGPAWGESFTDPGGPVGVKGTRPTAGATDEFRRRLLLREPDLQDFSYGPETYDAVIIMALAAERAGTDNPAEVARNINGVTRGGEACATFDECRDLIAGGEDIDYNGESGPLEFSAAGEPTVAGVAILSYGADNRIDDSLTEFRQAKF